MLALRIEEFRCRRGLKQKEIASLLGLAENAPAMWKKGKMPSSVTLYKIARRLGVSLDWLFGDDDAAMDAPWFQAVRLRLREHLRTTAGGDERPAKRALNWLVHGATNIPDAHLLPARLGATPEAVEAGKLSESVLLNLSELTGIDLRYWTSDSSGDMGPTEATPEAMRLYAAMRAQGISAGDVLGYLPKIKADIEQRRAEKEHGANLA